jgi:hypothetical protein
MGKVCVCCKISNKSLYRKFQEESSMLQDNIPWVKLYQYNQKYLNPKLNSYGDNGEINFKE